MRESRRPPSFNQVAVPSRKTSGGRFFLSSQLGGYEPDGPNRPNKIYANGAEIIVLQPLRRKTGQGRASPAVPPDVRIGQMHRRQGVYKPGAVRDTFIEGNTPCHQTQEEYEMPL